MNSENIARKILVKIRADNEVYLKSLLKPTVGRLNKTEKAWDYRIDSSKT